MRWAETTSTSYGTSNSSSAVAAASMTAQSESEPITTPTVAASAIDVAPQVCGRVPRSLAQVVDVVAADRDVADLTARAYLLAVDVDLQRRVTGHAVQVRRVEVGQVAAEDVDHDGERRGR